ncbi:MAG: nucleotidyltransferase family protein [Armatimonadetes bacterium]|nr:nucleotidyltransferase family protein [Armatimonadota bacterium]
MTTDAAPACDRLGAIVMANGEACKLARKLDVPHKALLDVGGAAMIDRVLQAVKDCPDLGEVVVSCLPDGPIARHLGDRAALAQPADPTFLGGIAEGFRLLPDMNRALLVTCDMPLLTSDAICYFAGEAARWPDADLVYGMVDVHLTRERYPEARRTAIKMREGNYTASGFSVVSRRFVEECGPKLMAAFRARKSKFAMARLLGYSFLARLAVGTLSLQQIIDRAEELLGGRCAAVPIPYPECGFDVDSEADLAAARAFCERVPAES